jgi:hypothetical protein
MNRKTLLVGILSLLLPALAQAQGIVIKSGADSNLATVDANKNIRTTEGPSTRQTFVATISGATTTAAYNLQVESAAGQGFKVIEICVGYSQGATAAGTIVTTTVSRRTTASSGGTSLTNNGTGTTSVSDLSGASVAYGGLAKGMAATLGTVGATMDQWAFRQSVLGATTGIEGVGDVGICRQYGSAQGGGQAIIVPSGVTNGLSVQVSAGGAGSVAIGWIRMTFIAE